MPKALGLDMKTCSRRIGRTPAVRSGTGPTLGGTATDETRRFRPFVKPKLNPIGPADRVLRRGVLNPSGSGECLQWPDSLEPATSGVSRGSPIIKVERSAGSETVRQDQLEDQRVGSRSEAVAGAKFDTSRLAFMSHPSRAAVFTPAIRAVGVIISS